MSEMYFPQGSALWYGLKGMASAVKWNRMAGHPPAAVIAAHFFCQENELEAGVEAEVQRLVDYMARGSPSIWIGENNQPVTNEALFSTEISGTPDESLIPSIGDALDRSLDACRDAGHNTIFASLALKALHAAPQFAFPQLIDGINQLLLDFVDRGPGAAHVPGIDHLVDPRTLPMPDGLDLPGYTSIEDMVTAVCCFAVPENFSKKGMGGPIHVINHAAAILDLEWAGYAALANKGLAAHHQHLMLWLCLPPFPESESAYRSPCHYNPRSRGYWSEGIQLKDQGGYEHRLKILYGAFRFAENIRDDADRRKFMASASYLY